MKILTKEELAMVQWIDNASYYELLRYWRFLPIGHPLLQGEIGRYFIDSFFHKKKKCSDPVMVSKMVGWADVKVVDKVWMLPETTPLPHPSEELTKALDQIKNKLGGK